MAPDTACEVDFSGSFYVYNLKEKKERKKKDRKEGRKKEKENEL